jgi:hypothetical protein
LENYYSFGGDTVTTYNTFTNDTIDIIGDPKKTNMAPTISDLKKLGYTDAQIKDNKLQGGPSVHIKLFYTDNCFSCDKLRTETIPGLIEKNKNAKAETREIDKAPITIFGDIYVAEERKQSVLNHYQRFVTDSIALSLPFVVMELISETDGKITGGPTVIPHAVMEKEEREKRTKLRVVDTYGLLGLISPWTLYADILFDRQRDLLYSYDPDLFRIGTSIYNFFGGERRKI